MNIDLLQHLQQFRKRDVTLNVKVTPSAPRDEIIGFMSDGTLKIRIHAAPEHGKATARLITFLSEELNTSEENIELVSGHTNTRKQLVIHL